MTETLKKNLCKLLDRNKVVFWYDSNGEFEEDYNEFSQDGVAKIELDGRNEFKVKYEILKKNPDVKYLLYAKYAEPLYEDNWLLDIQMANEIFHTDACSIYLSELSLPPSCYDVVKIHEKFFKSEKRCNDLKKINGYNSSAQDLEKAMISVCANLESYKPYEIAAKLIKEEFCQEKKKIYECLELSNLLFSLWNIFSDVYGYSGSNLSDFAVFIYEQSYKNTFDPNYRVLDEIKILLSFLTNDFDSDDLDVVSDYAYDQLGIKMKISGFQYQDLLCFYDYKIIDDLIIKQLVSMVLNGTISSKDVQDAINKRKDGKWYSYYEHVYNGIYSAIRIIEMIHSFDYEMSSYMQAVQNYASTWYEVDYCYREFCLSIQNGAIDYLSDLKTSLIDNKYLNSFLRPLNEEWSKQAIPFLKNGWKNPVMCIRERFYPEYIQKILDDKRTAVVIISDALRYEVGKELASEINKENRFSAVVDYCISSIPSYTQVGMASLLPNSSLAISPDGGDVFVDGKSSQGSDNREAILNSYRGGIYKSKVLDINEVQNEMDTNKLKSLVRDYDIIYIYQDVIDYRGETDLIQACSDAISQLKAVIKKLGSSNVTTMFVTSDHGFLYQNQDLAEYDFISDGNITGKKITKKNRRFVLGYGLNEIHGTSVVKLSDIGYSNEDGLEAAFPNSILRFRLSGANTHFVHGGLSLQEIVVPVLRISKGRSEDISYVSLQLLSRLNTITTGSVSLKFYQDDYVSEKNRGFDAVFGIYAEDGTLLSNEVRKSISSDAVEIRDREFTVDFSLNSDSNKYRNKTVYLIVKQIVDNGRMKDILKKDVLLKKNNMFGELDF